MKKQPLETAIHEGPSAVRRLRELGLDLEGMQEALRRGERARAEHVDYDAKTFGGQVAYLYRVRAYREIYCPRGWEPLFLKGLEFIRSADRKIGVITRAGDSGVGDKFALKPQPKGEVGEGASETLGQILLLDPKWFSSARRAKRSEFEVWFHLVYATPSVVRSELSHATGINEDGRVEDWYERIILPDLDPNDPDAGRRVDDDGSDDQTIDVPVSRKK